MANHINISPPAARGLLRLAIKDQVGPFKLMNEIFYKDLKITINNSLKYRLEHLDLPNVDDIVKNLLDSLSRNQSLMTMGKV